MQQSNGFTVKYKQITSPHFNVAFQTLSTMTLPVKTAYNIKKMADALHVIRKQIGADYQKFIVEKFAKKNEDGTIAHPKDEAGNELKDQFDLDDSRKEDMQREVESFGETEVTIGRYKLVWEDLGTAELSAAEISALDPIFSSIEEVVSSATSEEKAG